MLSVFYDLETSDKIFAGQILNFSFISVDRNYEIVDEYSDSIRISDLQLPAPYAIRANKTDVIAHQEVSLLTERQAMLQIVRFLEKQLSSSERLNLIGFNSSRFDLPYLRTSLMRNGLNPYFYGKLQYRDLLHAVRKLSVSNSDFPRMAKDGKLDCESGETLRLSLSLEVICQSFNLLKGEQAHSAREDVLLTIELAKHLSKHFSLDVRSYEAYEVPELSAQAGKGLVYMASSPNYELYTEEISLQTPFTLLDADHRSALWVDLDRYSQGMGRQSIQWISRQTGSFICAPRSVEDARLREVASAALEEFRGLNLRNYFETSTCDIEQDIYRVDISMLDRLHMAIWKDKSAEIKNSLSPDAKVLLLRHQLANYEWGGDNDQRPMEMLRQYGLYRYGGKMKINKFAGAEAKDVYHPTYRQQIAELEMIEKEGSDRDRDLMRSLKQFYIQSRLYRACAAEFEQAAS